MYKKKAFSMIEVLVGICLFALAILPMVWLNTTQTKTAFSAGKHMMAGQLAASYMDNLLKRSYDDLKEIVTKSPIESNVLDSNTDDDMFNLEEMISNINDDSDSELKSAEENMKTAFRYFKYKIVLTENKKNKTITIETEVFYRVEEGDTREQNIQSVKLSALKFGNLDE